MVPRIGSYMLVIHSCIILNLNLLPLVGIVPS
eukprot:SAG31_NODE_23347_length_506_cov_0.877150_2_plen_31_part_01